MRSSSAKYILTRLLYCASAFLIIIEDNLLYSDARKQFPRGVRVTSIRIVNKQRIDAYVPDAYTDNILSFIKNDTNGEWSTSNGNKDYDVNEVDPAEFDVRDKIKYATRYWIVL